MLHALNSKTFAYFSSSIVCITTNTPDLKESIHLFTSFKKKNKSFLFVQCFCLSERLIVR